jgi:hypothetical protein
MKTTYSILIGALASVLLLTNCSKTGPAGATGATGPTGSTGATGSTGPALSGNLKGFISLYDAGGAKMTGGLSGDSVFIDGTNTKTVTDVNGMYSFPNLTTGVYNLTVTKPGYGSIKLQNIGFAGGGDTYRDGRLSVIPAVNVASAVCTDTTLNSINNVKIRLGIPALATTGTVIIYVSSPGATSVTSATTSYSAYYTKPYNASTISTGNNYYIQTSDLHDLGFATGNTVYFSIYFVGSALTASSYEDFTNGKTVYTALSPTPIATSVANIL